MCKINFIKTFIPIISLLPQPTISLCLAVSLNLLKYISSCISPVLHILPFKSYFLLQTLFSLIFSPITFSSVQSRPTLCNPMNRSTPGLPVHHQLLEFTHTDIHLVSDAIQPSHPLSSPSPPAPNPFQHQSFPMSQLFA